MPTNPKSPSPGRARSLTVRLDDESKACLSDAARLRGLSLGEYVKAVAVPQARRELSASREQTLAMAPEEQLAFWNALHSRPKLTESQERLGAIMRGEA